VSAESKKYYAFDEIFFARLKQIRQSDIFAFRIKALGYFWKSARIPGGG
jgi:hypothetical protein